MTKTPSLRSQKQICFGEVILKWSPASLPMVKASGVLIPLQWLLASVETRCAEEVVQQRTTLANRYRRE
jgi:hypothetical protein